MQGFSQLYPLRGVLSPRSCQLWCLWSGGFWLLVPPPPFFPSLLTLLVHWLKKALDKVCADCEAARQALCASMEALRVSTAHLECVKKQAELLEQCGALMLLKKAQAVEDLKELERLEAEAEDPESSCSKRLCHEGSNANPSSSNTQAVSSNSAISVSLPNVLDGVDLSALSHLPSWDSSLADLFSSGVVDPLASGNPGSGGGTP